MKHLKYFGSKAVFTGLSLALCLVTTQVFANEVFPDFSEKVVMRHHPKTGREYVVLVPQSSLEKNGEVVVNPKMISRPDYAMLRAKGNPSDVQYEGPVSDRTKVYVFAATIATIGAVGGTVGMIAAPATAGGSASGGAGYLVGGALTSGGIWKAVHEMMKAPQGPQDGIRTAETVTVRTQQGE